MDHAYIDAADIVSRYVLRRLNAEEEQAFEAHFVDCPECLDRIDQTRRLRAGLAALATNAAASPAAAAAPVTGSAAMSRWLALAAGLVLGAALALAAAQIINPRDRDRGEPSPQPPQAAAPAAAPQPAAATTAAAADPEKAAAVPVVALSIVRGATTPPTPVRLSESKTPFVVLLLDIGAASFKSYRVTLTKNNATVWTADRLTSSTRAELAVAVPSTLLQAGEYAVRVDGEDRAGRVVSAGHYAFRLTP